LNLTVAISKSKGLVPGSNGPVILPPLQHVAGISKQIAGIILRLAHIKYVQVHHTCIRFNEFEEIKWKKLNSFITYLFYKAN
jgi:hypothetical protein